MTRRLATLLDHIAADDDLLAAFRAQPQETAARLGVLIDDELIEEMYSLEADAVIDFVAAD